MRRYMTVNYDLLIKEILTKREFSTRWIQWINSIISNCKSCVRIVGVAYAPNLCTASMRINCNFFAKVFQGLYQIQKEQTELKLTYATNRINKGYVDLN
jgi:hypothetical protein